MARIVPKQSRDSAPLASPSSDSDGEVTDLGYVPRTPLGVRLMELRRRIVASGQPLLDWDEIEREIAERRGGQPELDR